jgi:hypothetical protein
MDTSEMVSADGYRARSVIQQLIFLGNRRIDERTGAAAGSAEGASGGENESPLRMSTSRPLLSLTPTRYSKPSLRPCCIPPRYLLKELPVSPTM